ncbi:MAG: glycosyltransferase family 9 protein [Pseudomonadota bacterium]
MHLNNTDKILILASASTGNNVFCTPAIQFLRKHLPQATIDVVALNKLSAEVFENSPDINRLIVLNRLFGNTRAFDRLAKNYNQHICLNINALKKIKGRKTPLKVIPEYVNGVARGEQQLQFVASLINQPITDADRQYVIGSGVASKFAGLGNVSATDVLVNIHLGCGTTSLHGWKFFYKDRANNDRLWSVDQYIALGQALIKANPAIRIVVTGTKNEAFLAKQFQQNVPNTINLVGKTSAKDVFDLMQDVSLFIAHDCGVFHLASASTVPIVGLYGPTDPILAGPYPVRPQHHIIKAESMAAIQTAEVLEAALNLLVKFPRLATA